MSIKVYPTEVEAIEDGRKIYTISLEEPEVYTIRLETMFDKKNMEVLFDSIRNAVKLLEIEE